MREIMIAGVGTVSEGKDTDVTDDDGGGAVAVSVAGIAVAFLLRDLLRLERRLSTRGMTAVGRLPDRDGPSVRG